MLKVTQILAGMAALALGTASGIGTAAAQSYPDRPITMVVPFAAGGPSDAIARLVGQSMSTTLGQQVVIENVGGAGGTLGASRAARADADGYTLLIAHVSLAAAASLYPELDYKTESAFTPVGLVNTGPMVLLARKDMEDADAAALLSSMKTKGEDIAMGHAGVGSNSYLCGVLLEKALGVKFTQVAYKGTGPAMNDLIAGKIDVLCDQSTTAMPQIAGNTIKGYAVSSKDRMEGLKDLPTLAESGLDGFDFTIWHGIYAPAGTPDDVVAKLNDAINKAVDDTKVTQRFTDVGTTAFPAEERTPAAHAARFQAEIEKWRTALADVKPK